ncbi:hypothetical protein ACFQL0_10870 [Haloplanus litoreus]|uniref:hypothetical protein n=1 Tax=Haloplanus litoreus TaxID=767515 RepID=UPI00361326E3
MTTHRALGEHHLRVRFGDREPLRGEFQHCGREGVGTLERLSPERRHLAAGTVDRAAQCEGRMFADSYRDVARRPAYRRAQSSIRA